MQSHPTINLSYQVRHQQDGNTMNRGNSEVEVRVRRAYMLRRKIVVPSFPWLGGSGPAKSASSSQVQHFAFFPFENGDKTLLVRACGSGI